MIHRFLGGPRDGEELDLLDCSSIAVAVPLNVSQINELPLDATFTAEWWECRRSRYTGEHLLVREGSQVFLIPPSTESGLL